jgi:hypothetical protein
MAADQASRKVADSTAHQKCVMASPEHHLVCSRFYSGGATTRDYSRVGSVNTHQIYCQLQWLHVSTQTLIIRPIIGAHLKYIKRQCTFLESQNIYKVRI